MNKVILGAAGFAAASVITFVTNKVKKVKKTAQKREQAKVKRQKGSAQEAKIKRAKLEGERNYNTVSNIFAKKTYVDARSIDAQYNNYKPNEELAKLNEEYRALEKHGHVTVYDAVKKQYVSVTPQEASRIKTVNEELAKKSYLDMAEKADGKSNISAKTIDSQYNNYKPNEDLAKLNAEYKELEKQGHVTVYDAVKKQYVSATPQEAKKIAAANEAIKESVSVTPQGAVSESAKVVEESSAAASTAEQAVQEAANGADDALHSSGTVVQEAESVVGEAVEDTEKAAKKSGFWSKIKGAFGKGKGKGKAGMIIGTVLAIGAGLYAVSNKGGDNRPNATKETDKTNTLPTNDNSAVNNTEQTDTNSQTSEEEPIDPAPEDVESPADGKPVENNIETQAYSHVTAPAVATADTIAEDTNTEETEPVETEETDSVTNEQVAAQPAEETDTVETTQTPAEETTETEETSAPAPVKHEVGDVSGDKYNVIKGDNLWIISKAHLKELNKDKADYEPTDAEILKHTKELMDLNKLQFEKDNYHVMIKPEERLKLIA